MCHAACIDFVRQRLHLEEVKGREVLEVGALNVNGSVRPLVCALQPGRYIGVDIKSGRDVDEICDASELVQHFGRSSFDLLISTEMLEHVRDWRKVISEFKHVLRPGGLLVITTRSLGFPYHAFPDDFWRYEQSDLEKIFSDFDCEAIESDPSAPGVFLKARKPKDFVMYKPDSHALFSMITRRRVVTLTDAQLAAFRRRGKWQQIIRAPEWLVRRWRRKLQSQFQN